MIKINNILDIEKYIDDVKVVIFDLDDTLYSEKDYVFSGFLELEKSYPFIKKFALRLKDAFLSGKKPIDFVLGEENLLSEKDNCVKIYRNHLPSIRLYDGVFDMLIRLGKSKKLGLITDGRVDGQKNKIKALGISKLFDKIVITDELGGVLYRKPNTTSFKVMNTYFNCAYEEMCYVGDKLKKDGEGPLSLGMKFIFFENKDGLYNDLNS